MQRRASASLPAHAQTHANARAPDGRSRLAPGFLVISLMAGMLPTAESADGVKVELRSFIAHGDLDGLGVSCLLVNGSQRAVSAWIGYDGGRNRILSEAPPGAIVLVPPAQPATLGEVRIEAGASRVLFTLSADTVLLLHADARASGWGWAWAGRSPRAAPPLSPLHGQAALGWELQRAESATVFAEIEVDGRPLATAPLVLEVPLPRVERIQVRARPASADWTQAREPRYAITLEVVETLAGHLADHERTLRLPEAHAEQLLAAAGARQDTARNGYAFASPLMRFDFARILDGPGRRGRIVLTGYAPTDERPGPPAIVAAAGAQLIGASDIRAYHWSTHTVTLRAGVLPRLRQRLGPGLPQGVPFTLRLGETVLYPGVFTLAASPTAQSLPVALLDGADQLRIQLGHPSREQFRGEDPRGDERLREALRAAGLLRP